jgi:DNA-binding SARP family transcriptional activator/WD40 repeat protein
MGIAVLGPLTVDGKSTVLPPRDRVVLEALALRCGGVVSTDQLADALWPGTPPATWHKVVQGSVARLRKMLGPDAIETAGRGYRLVLGASELDTLEFERLVGRAREQLIVGEAERASYTLGEALGLWRGRALVDLEGWDAGRLEADRLDELRRDAEELRLEAALRTGHHREVLAEAQKRVEEAPLRERRWELLARAQYQSGRQADALRTLHQVKAALVHELGLDPGPGLVSLEEAILRQDRSLLAETALPGASNTCPYLGLVPYDVADADGFFGRDADVTACLHRLASAGVLAVVGPSGSGKSSLVRAGLAASLQRDGGRVLVVTPGPHPMDALTAIPSTGRPVVLVVDQCEEAVALCDDPAEQSRFFAALTAHAARGRLVVALRADRLGDLAAQPDFARLVERGLYLLNPMNQENLRDAIEGPARQAGLHVEPGLVELLVRDVEGEPGALPHLSHALRQTWQRREGAVLTLDGYRAAGGIRNAVARSAERLYEQIAAEQRGMLRDLMLRLVTPSEDGEPVRSRVPRRLLTADPEHDQLLELLVAARLVTSDQGVVALAHEALARAWPRLRGWLDDDTEGQRILRHLTVAADTWDAMGRPDSELYRGSRLGQALDWRAGSRPDLTSTERSFLDASQELAETEERTAAQQARHQTRVNRRLRQLLAASTFLLVTAVVAGSLAIRQANRADDATAAADARRVAAQAQLTDRIDQSLLLALAAMAVEPSSGARAALLSALGRSPQLTSFVPAGDQPFWHLDVSPDGDTIGVMDGSNRVRFYDASTQDLLAKFDPHPAGWRTMVACVCDPLTFSPDGRSIAIGLVNGSGWPVRLLDARTFRPADRQLGSLPTSTIPGDMDYSADGRYLAVTFTELSEGPTALRSSAYVWDLKAPAAPVRRIPIRMESPFVELSPDGSLLYAIPGYNSDAPNVAQVFDVTTGRAVQSLGRLGQPWSLSPDGSTIGYADGTEAVLVDASTGREVRRLPGHQGRIRDLEFSSNGELLASISEDRTANVWAVSSGGLRESLQIGAGELGDVDFSPGGESLLASVGPGLLTFDLSGTERYIRRAARPDPGYDEIRMSRTPSPRGGAVLLEEYHGGTGSTTSEVTYLRTGRRVRLQVGSFDPHSWRPDGRRLAGVDDRGRLLVLDPITGAVLRTTPLQGLSDGLEYSNDGSLLLASGVLARSPHGGAVLMDAETLQQLTEPVVLKGRVIRDALLGPTGHSAIVLTSDVPRGPFDFTLTHGWAHVDLDSGKVHREGGLASPAGAVSLSPDNERFAVAGNAGIEIIDLRSGASRRSHLEGTNIPSGETGLAYSDDGKLLVSAHADGIRLWDGRTAALLGAVSPSATESTPLFDHDGRTVLVHAADGGVYEWDTSVEHAVSFACKIVGRSLSKSEWKSALPGQPYIETCPDE